MLHSNYATDVNQNAASKKSNKVYIIDIKIKPRTSFCRHLKLKIFLLSPQSQQLQLFGHSAQLPGRPSGQWASAVCGTSQTPLAASLSAFSHFGKLPSRRSLFFLEWILSAKPLRLLENAFTWPPVSQGGWGRGVGGSWWPM